MRSMERVKYEEICKFRGKGETQGCDNIGSCRKWVHVHIKVTRVV